MKIKLLRTFLVLAVILIWVGMTSDLLLRTEGRTPLGSVSGSAHSTPVTTTSKKASESHTVTWWCVDLNELWHVGVPVIVSSSALTPPYPSPLPPCASTSLFPITVPAGSGWVAGGNLFWATNKTYPPAVRKALAAMGYHFASNNPMEDFMQKIAEVRYVVVTDPGNEVVNEFSFDARQTFRLLRLREYYGERPVDAITYPDLGIDISEDAVGRLPLVNFPAIGGGLLPGSYRVRVYWVLSDVHNDGLGLENENFLPEGELLMSFPRFIVVP